VRLRPGGGWFRRAAEGSRRSGARPVGRWWPAHGILAGRMRHEGVPGSGNRPFCGAETGGHTAAVLFCLITTCQRHQVAPFAYLRDVLTRAAAHPMTPPGRTAAGSLATEPTAGRDLFSHRGFLRAWIEVELILSLWFVSGLARRAAWLALRQAAEAHQGHARRLPGTGCHVRGRAEAPANHQP